MNRARITLAATAALALIACAPAAVRPAAAQQIRTPEALLRAMRDRYAGRWYTTLSFTQKTTRRLPNDSMRVETWHEWGAMPGRLRIEIGEPAAGNGVIYANDSAYVVRGGNVVARRGDRNSLMVLGFDVYVLSPERTAQVLTEEGFLPGTLRTDSWNGRPVYVVTSEANGHHEFWIDAENLLYVRSVEPIPGPNGAAARVLDVRFEDYKQHGGGWMAERVDIRMDGKTVQMEEYSDVKVNQTLSPDLFVPEKWSTAPKP
jgi:outer membrane lipoprotein-sorting protein